MSVIEITNAKELNAQIGVLKDKHRNLENRNTWLSQCITINGVSLTMKAEALSGTIRFRSSDGSNLVRRSVDALI